MDDSLRVLVVARPALVEEVADGLESAAGGGMTITTADSAGAAREAIAGVSTTEGNGGDANGTGDAIDCVVSGQVLPDGTGLELLGEVRRQDSLGATILFPDDGSETLASDAFAAGIADYVPMDGPETYDTLVARIHAAVGSDRIEQSRAGAIADVEGAAARFETLLETVPSPAVLTDDAASDPIIRAVNPAFETTFGLDAQSVVGRNLDDLIVPQDDDPIAVPDEPGEVLDTELRRRTVDGVRDFRLRGARVPTGEGLAVYLDVTEWNQQRQRLRVLSRVLRHDIRNRMNIIEGRAALLADQLDDPEKTAATEKIRIAAVELMSLSEKTQRVEGAMAEATSRRRLDVADELITVLSGLSDAYPEATIHREMPSAAWIHGTAALPTALEEVVRNAIEHNPAEDPCVWVEVGEDGTSVEVAVRDDAPPIPETEVDLVTGAREATQLEHASGLGLWMVTWIVGGAGGEIDFDPNGESGNTITMRFPGAAPPESGVDVAASEQD